MNMFYQQMIHFDNILYRLKCFLNLISVDLSLSVCVVSASLAELSLETHLVNVNYTVKLTKVIFVVKLKCYVFVRNELLAHLVLIQY